jgi:precorrin-6B methylase 2
LLLLPTATVSLPAQVPQPPLRFPDVIFVPTPQDVVDVMLRLAKVSADDVVYDLGSGDGRIAVTAARTYGARGVGIEIDGQRIPEANENLKAAGVADKVRFLNQDLFSTDISEATVVTLYLLPSLNLKLLPKLNKELRPGTRVVSHAFDLGSAKPQATVTVNGRILYLWTTPIGPSGSTSTLEMTASSGDCRTESISTSRCRRLRRSGFALRSPLRPARATSLSGKPPGFRMSSSHGRISRQYEEHVMPGSAPAPGRRQPILRW